MSASAGERLWFLTLLDRLSGGRERAPIGLVAQFRRNVVLYAIGTVMLLAQQAFMAQRDFMVRASVDAVDAQQGDEAARAAIMILVVSVSAAITRMLSRATMFTAGRSVEYELRSRLLEHLHRLGPSFFGTVPTGDIMSRCTNDLQQVRLLLGFGVLNVVSSVFAFISALYVMLAISVRLTLAALVVLPMLALIMRAFSTRLFHRNRDNQEAIGKMSERVLASLSGIRVVRSFAMEQSEIRAFEVTNQNYLEKSLALARLRGSMFPVMGTASSIGVLVVFWYGGILLNAPDPISKGDFVAFWMALLRLTWPMMAVGFVAAIVQRGRAGYARLRTIFDAEPDVKDGDAAALEQVKGEVEVKGLSFSFGERRVLDDVSLVIPAGSSLAILGRTGSGKSTLAALLPRLLATPKGAVFLDGVDVCDLPVSHLRASIGYAQQDAFLFSTTVADNISFALPSDLPAKVRRKRVKAAAREANVLDDILGLPGGFETVVGERGVQVSGGQKQRVALARALVREPPVLVLDDPMSAVDARTEKAILEAIDRQAAARSVILITHRVAAAQRCDQVIVLDAGKVIERGTHDELMAAEGVYALFAEEQRMEEDLQAISVPPDGLAGEAS